MVSVSVSGLAVDGGVVDSGFSLQDGIDRSLPQSVLLSVIESSLVSERTSYSKHILYPKTFRCCSCIYYKKADILILYPAHVRMYMYVHAHSHTHPHMYGYVHMR